MAKLRNLGRLAQTLLQYRLRSQLQEEDNEQIGLRQAGNSLIDDFYQRGRMAEEKDNDMFSAAARDPRLAERLFRAGDERFASLGRTQNEMDNPVAKTIGGAKTEFELPTREDVINLRRGEGHIEDLTGISGLLEQRNAKVDEFSRQRELGLDRAGTEAELTALGTGRGEETATAEAHPAVMGRLGDKIGVENKGRVNLERSLSPIFVDRAGDEAYSRSMGTSEAQLEFEQNDPRLDKTAAVVIDNPDLLTQFPAQERARLIRHIATTSNEQLANRRQNAAKQAIMDSVMAVKELETTPGFAGAVGAKGPSSLFGILDEPLAGTDAAGYTNRFNKLKATLTLPNLEKMRGFGQVSVVEFKTVGDAASAINRSSPEKMFKVDTATLKEGLKRTWQANGLDPAEFDAIMGTASDASTRLQQLREQNAR